MGGEFGGRMDTCVCMAESLCCPLETLTTLLNGYTPISNKKLKKNIKLKAFPPVLENILWEIHVFFICSDIKKIKMCISPKILCPS